MCRLREATVYQRHTGKKLCSECFIKNVRERIEREIKRYKMINSNERILLALSGGKDSFVLLDVLSELHDPSKLGGVTVIEGIEGYNRAEDLERLKKYALERGVELHVTSIKELTGYSLDEIVKKSLEKNLKVSPCTFCGIFRRRGINYIARLYGYDKVATAHNLDDEVQTIIINILRGDMNRIITIHPMRRNPSELFVQRVKPLRKIYEYETAIYAKIRGYTPQVAECPYLNLMPSLRARVRDILYLLEEERPGTLLRIIETFDEIFTEETIKSSIRLGVCRICGEPTSPGRDICKACELLLKTRLLSSVIT